MSAQDASLGNALCAEAVRRMQGECVPRILKCVDLLTDDELWQNPNQHLASVGNLILHLCGNIRQWIISGIGGAEDTRDRDSEFSSQGPMPRAELCSLLEATVEEAVEVLRALEPDELLQTCSVQGFEESGVSIIVHVVEHFSYHTGQISLHAKLLKDVDLGYYAGLDLNKKG